MTAESHLDEIARECLKYIKADTARISKPRETMYLIIGLNRNTVNRKNSWVDLNGKRLDFNYVEESVIASGRTPSELIESTKEYRRLCELSMHDYLRQRVNSLV